MGNRGHQSPITVNRQPKPRILIVELDEVLCADLAQCLNGWGFEVVGKAVSGRQAVDMALATRPDIVLMAVGLSGDMDGIEAASLIRSEVDSDVIFLVAHSEDAELDRALETEPAAYLTRSISPWQLRATIEIALQTRRTEQRLRTSERQYGTLIETVPQGIIEIDASGHIVFANTTLETMFGYGRHEMTGKRIMDLVPSSTDIRAIQRFLGAAVDRQPSPTPWFGQGLKKDGTVIDLRVDWNYKRNEKGDLVGFMSVLSDMTESIRAQQALKESEERYRTLFEKAGDAIFILEAEGENAGQIVTANQTAAEMHGYSEEELRALRIGQLNAAQDARGVPERLERILKGEWLKEEVMHLRQDGTEFPVEISAGLLQVPNHKYVLAIDRDVTDRKLAEAALQRHKETLEALLNVSPDIAILLDREANILALNRPAAAKLGKPAEELLGKPVCSSFAPEVRERRAGEFRRVLETGERIRVEEIERGDLIYDINVQPVHGLNRSIEGVAVFARDVSEQRKAQETLLKSEQKFRDILETIADGYHEVDLAGNLTLANDSLCEILGYTREELIATNYRRLMDVENAKRIFRAYNTVFTTGIQNPEFNCEIIRKDGTKRYASLSISLIRESDGRPIGFHGIMRDVTDRKRLEEQLQQAAKMEAVGRLAGGVAHDFNNLLTAMMGYCDMLMRQCEDKEGSFEKLQMIYQAAERAARLTRQLLAFSRKQVLDVRVVDLNELIADLKGLLLTVIGEEVELETSSAKALGKVKVDPNQIEQIIVNLVVNARDAMPRGGKLTIETANANLDEDYARKHSEVEPGQYVMIAVSDNGVGMDAATRSMIFDPFFTTKPKGSGTGLGLATTYGIVKQHRGHISVYSEPGMGTTFKVYLPRSGDHAEIFSPVPAPKPPPRGQEVILIVEDEPIVGDLACEALELLGYTSLKASGPDEALAICQQCRSQIHLVLTDVVLPQMDGKALFKRLFEIRPGMKVIYMSGYTDNAIVHHGVLDKGVHFLQKPFTIQGLASKVRSVLDER